ncbi:hypothetical protein DMB42_45335 [Nonomuraea sp. WAC 01424]|uniref:hypothetical protein n=1 Tax=Nonomuraea sp. WAC 01424 TaxID=2203200 RepID=UPI000F7A7FFA|nr:hypothetical protein [Nonomuraea sp. WAC 01424]RSM98227.1 hypothetical protein DMB42_45335 [Nonomuraea sp. WAC 01424]
MTVQQETPGRATTSLTRRGRLQFDRHGIAASDLTAKLTFAGKDDTADEFDPTPKEEETQATSLDKPERIVRIGRTSYLKGGPIGAVLPAGKTWYKQSLGWTSGVTAMQGDFINPVEPSTLKAMPARSKWSGNTYKGSMTVTELQRVSAWTRATLWWKLASGVKVNWTLTVTPAGLPRTMSTRLSSAKAGLGPVTLETSYSGWGAKVSVKAPPASQTTTKLDSDKALIRLPPGPKR